MLAGVEANVGAALHGFREQQCSQFAGQCGRQGLFKEEPDVSTGSRSRAFQSARHFPAAACFNEGGCVFPPGSLVEISGKEEAGLVLENRVDTGDEWLAGIIASGKVPPNHVVGDREESAVRAIRAFDARLLADARNPLVPACRGISGFSGSPAFEAPRIDVVTSPDERAKQRNFGIRRRTAVDNFHPAYAYHNAMALHRPCILVQEIRVLVRAQEGAHLRTVFAATNKGGTNSATSWPHRPEMCDRV